VVPNDSGVFNKGDVSIASSWWPIARGIRPRIQDRERTMPIACFRYVSTCPIVHDVAGWRLEDVHLRFSTTTEHFSSVLAIGSGYGNWLSGSA
jgi:hypothetical protein